MRTGRRRLAFTAVLSLLLVGCGNAYYEPVPQYIPPPSHDYDSGWDANQDTYPAYPAGAARPATSTGEAPYQEPIQAGRPNVPIVDPLSVDDSHLEILREQRRHIQRMRRAEERARRRAEERARHRAEERTRHRAEEPTRRRGEERARRRGDRQEGDGKRAKRREVKRSERRRRQHDNVDPGWDADQGASSAPPAYTAPPPVTSPVVREAPRRTPIRAGRPNVPTVQPFTSPPAATSTGRREAPRRTPIRAGRPNVPTID